jgi:hypothetical protein
MQDWVIPYRYPTSPLSLLHWHSTPPSLSFEMTPEKPYIGKIGPSLTLCRRANRLKLTAWRGENGQEKAHGQPWPARLGPW